MTVISQDGRFEWDSEKDATNVKKHGFSFSEILEVYDDPYMLTMYDSVHSSREEDRYFCVGCIRGVVLITTCHTERNGRIRLISALKAEKNWRNCIMSGSVKVSNERLKEIADTNVNFDDDIPQFSEEQLKQFKPVNPQLFNITPKKIAICIKIDADVLDKLKKDGPGYQTRINNILRKAVI